jgi:UDP-3-O-[3-hydroxymyristoyl] N-acetylglucosamine deacetylase
MAALAGTGIHNALIEIDGPEVPILDGSSAPFVQAILARGARRLPAPVRALEIRSEIRVETDAGWAALAPSDSFEMAFDIEFPDAAIGRQRLDLDLSNGAFVRELCDARTFCRQSDVAAMRANGLALGGTLRNAVVVEGDRVLSPGGLRRADEAVRHKMLDAVGDLALAGGPVFGRYTGHRAGHALTNMLLRKLFATPGAVRMVSCDPARAARLPGVGAELAQMPAVA